MGTAINFKNSKGEDDTFAMNTMLYNKIQIAKEFVAKKDYDLCFLVDGPEGSGKSVFAMQLAYSFDPTFSLEHTCFSPEEFLNAVKTSGKCQAIVYDEAYRGLSSRQAMSQINKLIVSVMMEMRQKNLIVIIVLPTFFMLDRYVAIFRSKGLFHIYQNKGRRGYWLFYNEYEKKVLYILGKKLMSYGKPRVKFKGTFNGKYVIDEDAYKQKKSTALFKSEEKKLKRTERNDLGFEIALCNAHFKRKMSYREISEEYTAAGLPIAHETVRQICEKYRDSQEIVRPIVI